MNKPYRFMIEYANFQKKRIEAYDLMNKGIKAELIRRIDHYIRMFQRGYITENECMRLISLPDNGEDMSKFCI